MIRTTGTDSKQTRKRITRLIEPYVVDELTVDDVVHVEVADDVQQVPEALLLQMLCPDVGKEQVDSHNQNRFKTNTQTYHTTN